MRKYLWGILAGIPFVAGWVDAPPPLPHAGPMPDDPGRGWPSHYQSVVAGTKSYRPVDPLPWGDINRRVAPPPPKNDKSEPPEPKR